MDEVSIVLACLILTVIQVIDKMNIKFLILKKVTIFQKYHIQHM